MTASLSNTIAGHAGIGGLVAVAGLLAGACGANRAPVYSAGDVDQPPELLGCPAEELGVGPRVVVPLIMVIGPDGRVESTRRASFRSPTDRTSSDPALRPNRQLVDRARDTARGCAYTPALRGGMPVRYRLVREFTFAYTPDYHADPMGSKAPVGAGSPPDSLR